MIGRIGIDNIYPTVSGGRDPVKATAGNPFSVTATIWRDGQEAIDAAVIWRSPGGDITSVPMTCVDEGLDQWQAALMPDRPGRWTFQVQAWSDPWLTWQRVIGAKVGAGFSTDQLANEVETGARLLERQAEGAPGAADRTALARAAAALRDASRPVPARITAVNSPGLAAVRAAFPLREFVTSGCCQEVWADRPLARFGSWYELFPRSTGARDQAGQPVHGTFTTTRAQLPRIAEMGFDVVYLPPIHPIGREHRKGRNNALVAAPGDVGSPWAVGSAEGGHDAVHPALGTLGDFDELVAHARRLGLEIALDLAFQCAPDHPWVKEHPEWFTTRPDGSIACAENPPKIYQDIYPLNFDQDREGLYTELLRITRFWIGHGVRIFRVDNPHTKPMDFWHRLIRDVKETDPDTIFLAEAFTRPAMLQGLAKLGFTQSYTYFTWRDTKAELTGYLTELAASTHFLTPNFFVNTPDILPASLRAGHPGMFAIRAALAATLSPVWGVYAGFELLEHQPLAAGSEEYLNSEKYELKARDYAAALMQGRSLEPWIRLLNQVRRDHPALRQLRTLRFHPVDNDELIAFSKTDPVGGDAVLCVVSLSPGRVQRGTVRLDLPALGLNLDDRVTGRDEVTGQTREWAPASVVEIDPRHAVAQIVAVTTA